MSDRDTPTPSDASASRSGAAGDIVAALNAGRPAAALTICRSALAGAPADGALNALAAVAAYRAGRPRDAEAFARRCLAVQPDHLPVLIVLGRAVGDRGGDAVPTFRHAVACGPGRAEPAFLLCGALLKAGDPEAQVLLNDLTTRFPQEGTGWAELGDVLSRLGRREAALVCVTRAAKARPDAALALRRGLLLRDLGRTGEAAAAFRDATALEPQSARAWFLLGTCAQDARDHPAAAAAYRQALARDSRLPEAALNLGTVLQEMGDLEGARASYRQAMRLRGDTFGRVAQALSTSPKGELWLDLTALRRDLLGPDGAA